MNNFLNTIKDWLDKSVELSKETLEKASGAVQGLGDKSVTKLEQSQLQKKIQNEYTSLGEKVYDIFYTDDVEMISKNDEKIKILLSSITDFKKKIEKCTEKLQAESEL